MTEDLNDRRAIDEADAEESFFTALALVGLGIVLGLILADSACYYRSTGRIL